VTPEEIRARALDAAVALLRGHATTVDAVVSLAEEFAEYIAGPTVPLSAGAPAVTSTSASELCDDWGPKCTGCGHVEGVHLSREGCTAPERDADGVRSECTCARYGGCTWTGVQP
jgi:hypothetical protein